MQQAHTQVVELATNLDDASGELVGDAVEQLLRTRGVLDVWTTPIFMKKQRPGVMLSLLCEADAAEAISRQVIALTGAFGVRRRPWERVVVDRSHETVETEVGRIRIKLGSLDGQTLVAKPEFEDVRQAAEQAGVTTRRAMAVAQTAAQNLLRRKGGAA